MSVLWFYLKQYWQVGLSWHGNALRFSTSSHQGWAGLGQNNVMLSWVMDSEKADKLGREKRALSPHWSRTRLQNQQGLLPSTSWGGNVLTSGGGGIMWGWMKRDSYGITLSLQCQWGTTLPIWGCESKRTIFLFSLQKRVIRTVISMTSFSHAGTFSRDLKSLLFLLFTYMKP